MNVNVCIYKKWGLTNWKIEPIYCSSQYFFLVLEFGNLETVKKTSCTMGNRNNTPKYQHVVQNLKYYLMYAHWVLIMNRLIYGNCASLRCGQQSTTQFSRDHLRQLHKRWHIIVSNNTIRITWALPSTLNSNWEIFCI